MPERVLRGVTDDSPRPALDAATLVYGRERWEALNARWHSGPLPWDQETAQAVHWMAQHADALLAAAAERAALAEEAARYRAALRAIEHGAAATASILLSGQTAPVLSGSLERIIQRCRAVLAPAAGEGAGDDGD